MCNRAGMDLFQECARVAGSFLCRIKGAGVCGMRMKELEKVPGAVWCLSLGTLRASSLAFVSVQGRLFCPLIILMPYKGGAGRSFGGHLCRVRWWVCGSHRRGAQERLLGQSLPMGQR